MLILDLGAGADLETRAGEDRLDPLECTRDRMQAAADLATPRQRHVDCAPLEFRLELGSVQSLATRLDGFLYRLLGRVDRLAGGRAFLDR